MTTVQNTLLNQIGQPFPGTRVEIYLLAPGPADVAFNADSAQVIGKTTTFTDANGVWSLDLIPNSEIAPANTAYKAAHFIVGMPNIEVVFEVPDSGGPFDVQDLLTTAPDDLPSLIEPDPLPIVYFGISQLRNGVLFPATESVVRDIFDPNRQYIGQATSPLNYWTEGPVYQPGLAIYDMPDLDFSVTVQMTLLVANLIGTSWGTLTLSLEIASHSPGDHEPDWDEVEVEIIGSEYNWNAEDRTLDATTDNVTFAGFMTVNVSSL